MLPQRSILRNTGPKRVAELSSQSRNACTGQTARLVPRRTTQVCWPPPGSCPAPTASSTVVDQGGTAQPLGGGQRQGAIAQASHVARTTRRHADQGVRPLRRDLPRRGGAAGIAQDRLHGWIFDGRGQAALTMSVARRAGPRPRRRGFGRRRPGIGHGGGFGRERPLPFFLAPSLEDRPVQRIEPLGRRTDRSSVRCRGPCCDLRFRNCRSSLCVSVTR
jgi:hypothetical protein